MILPLSKQELKALKTLLYSHNSCRNECVYKEMESMEEDCDECDFQNSLCSIADKIENHYRKEE